jgi:prolipoprotein diacylglyceryltransferase
VGHEFSERACPDHGARASYAHLGARCAVIAYFLWRIAPSILRRERPDGTVFACYLILTGWARFLVEFIRINPKLLLGLTNAQLAGILCFIGGAILLWKLPPGQRTA